MMHRILPLTALFLGSIAFAGDPAPTGDSAAAGQPAGDTTESAPVTLHQLLINALNANLELSAKRLDPKIQQNRLTAAWGAFDPNWTSGYTYSSLERPQTASVTSSIFGGVGSTYEENIHRLETGISGRLPSGTQYQVVTSTDFTRNTYNAASNSPYRPEVVSNSSITLIQPLLKDAGTDANLAEVRLQKSAITASGHELDATILRILRDVAVAYFEMTFAQANVRVKEEAVAVAANLVHENQRRADEGRMAPLDVTQARNRLSEAREELLLARNFLAQRRNTLRELTHDNFNLDAPDFTVDPAFIENKAPEVDRNRSLATLFERNPSYLANIEIARAEDIRIAYAQNQRWPRVDLKATFGYNGLRDDFLGSYKDYSDRTEPSWSAGVVVSIPIGNRAARGRVAEANNRKRQAIYNVKRTEVVLLSAFDTAMRDIANAAERLVLVKDSVALAQSAADAETARLASGRTTSFNVSQTLKDLSHAQSRELADLVDLNKAITQLHFVLGTLPEHLRLNIVQAE